MGALDLRGMLSAVHVPTLVMHRTGDRDVPIEGGRDVADRIAGRSSSSSRHRLLPVGRGSCAAPCGNRGVRDGRTGYGAGRPGARHGPVTDIVGSTERAAELGDARWKEVLADHDERAKAEIARFRGNYVNTTGDGLLATFDGPARAVRCAQAIVEAVGPLGLNIRAGCHTGEVELHGDTVRGIAVHVGARVASLPGPPRSSFRPP
jgi:hypothetical protein